MKYINELPFVVTIVISKNLKWYNHFMIGLFFVIGLLYGAVVDFGAFGGLNFIDGGNWFIYGVLGGFIGKFFESWREDKWS